MTPARPVRQALAEIDGAADVGGFGGFETILRREGLDTSSLNGLAERVNDFETAQC
jgi:hypothetical protein